MELVDKSSKNNLEALKGVATELRNPDITDERLKSVLENYRKLILSLITSDWPKKESNINLKFNNGIAISPTYAARCLTDFNRTKVFIRGIFNAIEKLKQTGKEELHIFYAGTGPYVTLLLPIMACYDSNFIQCSLLEVNKISFACAQEVIRNLGFQDYVKEFILADATKFQFEGTNKIDILLSETMSSGLKYEQQVPILLNLIPQLSDPFILIPRNIKLTLAFMKNLMSYTFNVSSREEDYCQRILHLLEINIAQIHTFSEQIHNADIDWKFPLHRISISLNDIQNFHNLVILTQIEVFESDRIDIFESDLTNPISITEFEDIDRDQVLTIRYKIDEVPGFIYEMRDA